MASRQKSPPDESVSIVGLGKVGLPIAAAMASSGLRVIGYDIDPSRTALLQEHEPTHPEILYETGLSRALNEGRSNLTIGDDIATSVRASSVSFIVVPTPSNNDGSFSLAYVLEVCRDIGIVLKNTRQDHLVVLVSTVSPGAVHGSIIPALERASGMRCGAQFSFCYSPALIALGNVIKGFLQPDLAFVGRTDIQGADRLLRLYKALLSADTRIHSMDARSVEIAKIALNNFLTMKISFANLIGQLCEKNGGSASAVLRALGDDQRIGRKFLKPGLGYGGPCLPRDTGALAASLVDAGMDDRLPKTVARLNEDHVHILSNLVGSGEKVAVLGLGYKSGSPVTIDSGAIALCNAMAERSLDVRVHDPLQEHMDLKSLHPDVKIAPDLSGALNGRDTIISTIAPAMLTELGMELPHNVKLIDLSDG